MFVKFNYNPKKYRASDCVIRAIAYATDRPWEVVYQDLCRLGLSMYRMPNEKKVYEKYLENEGFIKQKMPKHDNGTKYSVEELAKELDTLYSGRAVVSIARHLTSVQGGNIYDTWDCSDSKVGNYWVLPEYIR